MKLSELICENSHLWMEWNKMYAIGQNKDHDISDRARAYRESERIIDLINQNIKRFDEYCNNFL